MQRLSLVLIPLVIYGIAATYILAGDTPNLGPGSVSEQSRDLLWFCLLCGVAASATIEIIKRLTTLRGKVQLRETEAWLKARVPAFSEAGEYAPVQDEGSGDLIAELADAMGSPRRTELIRVFNLPTEQLVAQISRASDLALADVARYRHLLGGLMREVPRSRPYSRKSEFSSELLREAAFHDSQRVAAGIDQLQISLGEAWRRAVQTAGLGIAGVYGLSLVWAVGVPRPAFLFYQIGALVIGGLFSWVVRDLYAVIERLRRG